MKADDATSLFKEADRHYRDGQFDRAMVLLDELNEEYPDDRNLMYARARTLGKMGREDEALALCDRLVSEFGYSRAARLQVKLLKSLTEQIDEDAQAPPPVEEDESVYEVEVESEEPVSRWFQIKPVRLLLLVVIVALTLLKVIHPFVGIGIVVAYFVIKWVLGRAIMRLFMMPFKMKAQALAGATVQVHNITQVPNPDPELIEDVEESEHRDLRYVLIDVTVTPQRKNGGFTHWEPGELALAPDSVRIRGPKDLDHCFNVANVKLVSNGAEQEDEGYKLDGPCRIKLLVGVPPGAQAYQFVYYTEAFGAIKIPA